MSQGVDGSLSWAVSVTALQVQFANVGFAVSAVHGALRQSAQGRFSLGASLQAWSGGDQKPPARTATVAANARRDGGDS
jgi:hypothetical protein